MINVDKEREMLSNANKKLWDDVIQEEILKYAKEENLTIAQIELLRQRKMAEMRYGDLQGKNMELSKSNDTLAKRAINKNKLEMKEIDREYKALENEVKDIEQGLDNRIERAMEKQNSKKAGK